MLRCLTGIIGYRIDAIDGEIGKVRRLLVRGCPMDGSPCSC